jgi:RNA polymerase sigma-70 factor (ECF subfamily)
VHHTSRDIGNGAARTPNAHAVSDAAVFAPSEEAFAVFVATYEAAVFSYLWRATGDEHTAYDLRQEVFIRAWRHFAQVRDYERPLVWLYRVATNLALNEHRDRRPTEPLAVEEEFASSDPSWRVAERDQVSRTLQALPPRERLALALRSGLGLSCEEVAESLAISATAARSLLWRARERFRTLYLAADSDQQGKGPGGER